jgi:hypothetical protein
MFLASNLISDLRMEGFLLVALITVVLGGFLGWIFRGSVLPLITTCIALSLCLQLGSIFYFGPKVEEFSVHYLIGFSTYLIGPYILFFLCPLLCSALLVFFVQSRRRTKQGRTVSQG